MALGRVVRVAAPHQVAVHIAMRRPPSVPCQQPIKAVAQQPFVVKFSIQPKHRNRAHWRLRAVIALPVSATPEVRNKAVCRNFVQRLQGIGIRQIAVADRAIVAAKNVSQSNNT